MELFSITNVTKINTGRKQDFKEWILSFSHRKITAKLPAGTNAVILGLASVSCRGFVLDETRLKIPAKIGAGINLIILDREIAATKEGSRN